MDMSKLGQNEKLAIYGSAALIIGGAIGYGYGLTALGMLAAVAMLAIVFLPQLSPGTSLPGSHGSLMLAVGGFAGAVMVLALLQAVGGVLFVSTNFRDILFLVAVAGGVLMAWAGWQEFQGEGGKFQLGSNASSTAAPAPAPMAGAEPAAETPRVEAAANDEPRAADAVDAVDVPNEPDDEGRRPVA